MTTQITMADYSAKAFVLYGDGTRQLKDKLKTIGGRYNPLLKLNGQQIKGWVFSKSRKEAVSLLLSEVKEEKPVVESKPEVVATSHKPAAKKETPKVVPLVQPPMNWQLPTTTPPSFN